MSEAEPLPERLPPPCPACKSPLVPLTPRNRQILALANDFPWLCCKCFAVIDGAQVRPIESVKAQERSHFLALIQSLRTIEASETLQECCEGLRAGFAPASAVRYAWAEVAPELLPELWGIMEKIGGAIPPRPAVVNSKPRADESYIQDVLNAIGEVVRWCEARRGRLPQDDGPWSTADSPARWAKQFKVSPRTFKRRVKDGKIRAKILSDRLYQINLDDLPNQDKAGESGHK